MPLGILEATLPVIEAACHVRIDDDAVQSLADRLANRPFRRPEWRVEPHWWDETDATAQYVFVLDALNFCFWGDPKWAVSYGGRTWDGYWALAACLRRAIEEDVPLLDGRFLAMIDLPQTAHLLRGEGVLLLLPERAASLRRLGQVLLAGYGGRAAQFVRKSAGSATDLVRRLAQEHSSFNDVATYEGQEIKLYKRAQILCADLFGAFAGSGLGYFHDLDRLTAFADYKLPQILREFDVLVYSPSLSARVEAQQELPAGSPEEIEIRASTIWAVERLRRTLAERGVGLMAFEIDWYLWELAQRLELRHPYHRTRTLFY